MSAVSEVLLETIKELQRLPSLSNFALGGGTNLAIRYNHRKSIDIDLFCGEIIGFSGFENIEKELNEFYGNNLLNIDYPCKINDQYIFLRTFISKPNGTTIKVEVLQNMKFLYDVDTINDIRLISTKDIGIFKLMSASSRLAKKDIYDLNYITETINLIDLFNDLAVKQERFNSEEDKTIFDLDGEVSPTENPQLLLDFDNPKQGNSSRPNHSSDVIEIVDDSKTWVTTRIEWRSKMRRLYRHLGLPFPKPKGRSI